jgi:hypothetical protein
MELYGVDTALSIGLIEVQSGISDYKDDYTRGVDE